MATQNQMTTDPSTQSQLTVIDPEVLKKQGVDAAMLKPFTYKVSGKTHDLTADGWFKVGSMAGVDLPHKPEFEELSDSLLASAMAIKPDGTAVWGTAEETNKLSNGSKNVHRASKASTRALRNAVKNALPKTYMKLLIQQIYGGDAVLDDDVDELQDRLNTARDEFKKQNERIATLQEELEVSLAENKVLREMSRDSEETEAESDAIAAEVFKGADADAPDLSEGGAPPAEKTEGYDSDKLVNDE